MRCIEIGLLLWYGHNKWWININMRCIEMLEQNFITLYDYGLTLTWDVLK